MNILFTCAGRRNYLVKYFQSALDVVGGNVIAVDSDLYAPAMMDVERKYKVPLVSCKTYIKSLLEVCAAEKVDMLISLNDLELPKLARHRQDFAKQSVKLLISDSNVIDICSDKLKTYHFLKENGIDTPATYSNLEMVWQALASREIKFPLMVKPRWGSASVGLSPVYTESELQRAYSSALTAVEKSALKSLTVDGQEGTVIIQEFIEGQEYGLDILNNLECEHVCVFAKRKLGMRAGETDKSILVDDKSLLMLGKDLGKTLKHMGNLDADVFISEDRITVLELNPRFGGGYPFSHELGARYPDAIVAWASDSSFNPDSQERTYNTVVAKCDRLISCALSKNDNL